MGTHGGRCRPMASGGQIRSTRDGAGCCTLLLRLTPMLADTSPQARAGAGCDRAAFAIDFGAQQATCPQGHASSSWNPVTQRGTETIVITFARGTCGPGSVRSQCTTSASGRRKLTVHPRDVHEARSPPGLPRTPGTSRLDTRCAPVSRAPSAKAWPSPACPLPRTGQDPPGTRQCRGRAQVDPAACLVERPPAGQDPHQPPRQARTCLGLMNTN